MGERSSQLQYVAFVYRVSVRSRSCGTQKETSTDVIGAPSQLQRKKKKKNRLSGSQCAPSRTRLLGVAENLHAHDGARRASRRDVTDATLKNFSLHTAQQHMYTALTCLVCTALLSDILHCLDNDATSSSSKEDVRTQWISSFGTW